MATLAMSHCQDSSMGLGMIMDVERRIRQVRNEIEFVEILATFWPFSNMHQRMERLVTDLKQLEQVRDTDKTEIPSIESNPVSLSAMSNQAMTLPNPHKDVSTPMAGPMFTWKRWQPVPEKRRA